MHLADERIRFRVRQLVLPVTIDDSPESVQQLGIGDSLGLFPRLGLPRWVVVLAQKNHRAHEPVARHVRATKRVASTSPTRRCKV